MKRHPQWNGLGFIVRYAPLGAIPGMWFAYIGGVSPLLGAVAGLGAVAAIMLPASLVARRSRHGD